MKPPERRSQEQSFSSNALSGNQIGIWWQVRGACAAARLCTAVTEPSTPCALDEIGAGPQLGVARGGAIARGRRCFDLGPDLPSLLLATELPLFLHGLLHRGGPVLGVVVPQVPCGFRQVI